MKQSELLHRLNRIAPPHDGTVIASEVFAPKLRPIGFLRANIARPVLRT